MRGYEVKDIWLCDDGTLDTVIEYTCIECGETHHIRYSQETACDYRDPNGELREWEFYQDVVIPDLDSEECENGYPD